MKVVKFGGSSVADAGQFKKVKQIINSDRKRQIVVVSAAGKSSSEPVKMTDMLLNLEQAADSEPLFQAVSDRIIKIRNDLALSIKIEKDLQIIH